MQSRRPPVSTLLLPHPPLPHRRPSSMLSIDSQGSQPRTPRTGRSPNPSQVYFTPSRKSTDSWNSSNADETEWEWKPDQLLLLSRTLDALPAHLVTPFNGPIPPPNLLDKIARGVSTAKGPEDWPHSLRATRVKLIELARSKANKDDHRCQDLISEELDFDDASSYSYIHDGSERPLARRKPGRQSSMDFIDTAGQDIKNNPDIARLSRRLQRSERVSHVPAFHPYSRNTTRRSASPPPPAAVPSLIRDSSETLSSTASSSAQHRVLRHSISSMSSISMSSATSASGHPLPDPRVQRIRRSSLAAAPRLAAVTSPKPAVGVKRAPSYGALLQAVKREQDTAPADGRHERRDSGSYPSSDEEEKARTRNAKKARVKSTSKTTSSNPKNRPASPAPPPVPEKDDKPVAPAEPELDIAQLLASPPPSSFNKKKMAKVEGASKKVAPKRPAPMNLQRNPSMFGPELPVIEPASPPPPVPTKSTMATGTRTPPRSPIVAKPRARTHSIFAGSSAAAAAASLRAIRSPSPTLPLSPSPLSPASALACALSPTAHLVAPDTPASPSVMMSPPVGSRVKKTLKRVRRLVPGRRISFGSMRAVSEDAEGADEDGVEKTCLGSAFQLL